MIGDRLLAETAWGTTYAIFGWWVLNRGSNVVLRASWLFSFVVMFPSGRRRGTWGAVLVVPATIYGVHRHRLIGRPKSALQPQAAG